MGIPQGCRLLYIGLLGEPTYKPLKCPNMAISTATKYSFNLGSRYHEPPRLSFRDLP